MIWINKKSYEIEAVYSLIRALFRRSQWMQLHPSIFRNAYLHPSIFRNTLIVTIIFDNLWVQTSFSSHLCTHRLKILEGPAAHNWCTPNLILDSDSLILRLSNEVSFFPKFLLKSVQKTQNIKSSKGWMHAKADDYNLTLIFCAVWTQRH